MTGAGRRYIGRFERRFVVRGDEAVFERSDGTGARLGRDKAAALIAAMRATIGEADARAAIGPMDALFAAAAVALLAVLAGAVTGYVAVGCAVAAPAAALVLLLGPGLHAVRLAVAWRRGLRAAEAQVGRDVPLSRRELRRAVPANPLRNVAAAAGLVILAAGVLTVMAGWSLPNYARLELQRLLGRAAPVALLTVGALFFAARVADMLSRRGPSDAEIEEAAAARRRRPFR